MFIYLTWQTISGSQQDERILPFYISYSQFRRHGICAMMIFFRGGGGAFKGKITQDHRLPGCDAFYFGRCVDSYPCFGGTSCLHIQGKILDLKSLIISSLKRSFYSESTIFRVVTPCSSEIARRCRGTYHRHFQDRSKQGIRSRPQGDL
jgi:hypothetical protein